MEEISNYNPEVDSLDELNAFAHLAYEANKNFFGQDVEGIKVNLLYSREEMNQLLGEETPDWVVGNTINNSIKVFSPSVFGKVSSHSASDFMPVLTHEITHIYTNSIYGNYKNQYPVWFREACILGGSAPLA